MEDAMTLLFVYGTLKQGYGNSHHLKGAQFMGNAISIENNFVMQDVGFPTLWQIDLSDKTEEEDGGVPLFGQVIGEIYQINPRQLASCDRLESNGRMYTRAERQFKITKRGGMVVTAWVYLWNLDQDNDQIEPVDGTLIWDRGQRRKRAG